MMEFGKRAASVAIAAALVAAGASALETATVTIDPSAAVRAVKPMNGVNNGPSGSRGIAGARITCHLTDHCRAHTEYPLALKDGCVTVPLERNSFALVEFE